MVRVLALTAIVALAGCGEAAKPLSAEHVAFAKACVDGGGQAELCECQATKIDELVEAGQVTPDVQRAMLLQAQGKEEEAEAIMVQLPPKDLFEQPSLIAAAQLQCHQPS